ncbi:MAG: hypothetical protein JOZ81_00170 [Chloroflexi bacterium]|nr:hypothetical protein [Chloroflexota bacterium]
MKAGIAALQASGRKITAESIKQATRDLEPGFAGLSFQLIRRNARAYALYREAADASAQYRRLRGNNGLDVDGELYRLARNPARLTTHSNDLVNVISCGAFVD